MIAKSAYRNFIFKQASGTSRGILKTKESWFLGLSENGELGIGECSVIEKLSPDLQYSISDRLQKLIKLINTGQPIDLQNTIFESMPALRFCYEMALLDIENKGQKLLFDTDFVNLQKGIPINGLVWMGAKSFMLDQIKTKISEGYRCIKIKIAAIDFKEECDLLHYIRREFSADDIEIRVDANGGFNVDTAQEQLKRLSDFDIHSIEQPIAPNQWNEMAKLCDEPYIDIALDEELISLTHAPTQKEMLDTIQPQYIILKPSLLGGFSAAEHWVKLAEGMGIAWWATSALESNIGLNAIAQWTAHMKTQQPQGLGTGMLYTNNIDSPLYIDKGYLHYGNDHWGDIFV